jgi:hypothetical protein
MSSPMNPMPSPSPRILQSPGLDRFGSAHLRLQIGRAAFCCPRSANAEITRVTVLAHRRDQPATGNGLGGRWRPSIPCYRRHTGAMEAVSVSGRRAGVVGVTCGEVERSYSRAVPLVQEEWKRRRWLSDLRRSYGAMRPWHCQVASTSPRSRPGTNDRQRASAVA